MATFYNQATLTYTGGSTQSNITVGEIVDVLSVTKASLSDSYRRGERVTYAVSLVNSGATALNGLTISDDLGTYTTSDTPPLTLTPLTYVDNSVRYLLNGVLQATPTVTAGPPLTISGINIPAGGNAVIIYEALPNSFAVGDTTGSIVNTVTASGGGLANAISDSVTLASDNSSNLSITKSVSPQTVSDNGELTYTFVIENTGNTEADAADNVSLTDVFDPILSNISVTYNGAAWSAPTNYTYNEANGTFATVPGQITVPAATFTRNDATGAYTLNPGVAVITVTGTV